MPETKVLIVEDEDALSTLLEYNLTKEKFEVAIAADGEDGLLKVEEFSPDIIILDWMLPKVSGIEVCRRLRAKPETRNIPIIMLTARSEEADRIRGLDALVTEYPEGTGSAAEPVAVAIAPERSRFLGDVVAAVAPASPSGAASASAGYAVVAALACRPSATAAAETSPPPSTDPRAG